MNLAVSEQLNDKILAELMTSRQIVSDGLEVTPRFRIMARDTDYHLITPMYDDKYHRLSRLALVKKFMLWRGADSFIQSAETIKPNAIVCSLITADGVLSVYQLITRDKTQKPPHHVSFGQMEGSGEVDPLLIDILPKAGEQLTAEQRTETKALFGTGGAFEVKPVLH